MPESTADGSLSGRRLLSDKQAAAYFGICATTFRAAVKDGLLPAPIRIRRRALWDVRELDAVVDRLSDKPGSAA